MTKIQKILTIYLLVFLAIITSNSGYSQIIPSNEFADWLFENGEYYRAITEYYRILHTNQESNLEVNLLKKIASCYFYGEDYPFEVDLASSSKTTVNTLRSIEYYMEVYKYEDNCYDRFHDLDFNFDEAIVYNTEQCSGLLRLNLKPKNNAPEIINYPIINANNIDILYSKEEQKYRFNQFWDITDDRGEFNPAAERVIFNTEANGYIRNLNPNNLNYDKFQLERKKFRHYMNTILLRRRVSGDKNMNVTIAINKNLLSPR